MIRWCHIVAVVMLNAILTSNASAWMRMRYEDQQVVERSELIVVGRLKVDSIRYVPHERGPHGGRSWEHHATLLIDEILKGTGDAKEQSIVIHFGLTPVVGDRWEQNGSMVAQRGNPPGSVAIVDTGNSAMSLTPLVPDAAKNHIWCLRRLKDRFGGGDARHYGIADPEDLQPIDLKAYLQCYLGADPESAVREQIQKQPAIAERAMRYLAHCEIQRIAKLDDPRHRVERALPYWLAGFDWNYQVEATRILIDSGAIAGPYLVGVFESQPAKREKVVKLWGLINYRECVPRLIALLEQHDRFWQHQMLQPNWWNDDSNKELRSRRRDIYGETYAAVGALDQMDDPAARRIIEQTRARWAAIDFSNAQIVEACENALKRWTEKPGQNGLVQ